MFAEAFYDFAFHGANDDVNAVKEAIGSQVERTAFFLRDMAIECLQWEETVPPGKGSLVENPKCRLHLLALHARENANAFLMVNLRVNR